MTYGAKKFGPAFSASEQQEILTSLSDFMKAKGASFSDFKDALLVPKTPTPEDPTSQVPTAVHIRFHTQPSQILEFETSEHVRFVRGVLNDPTQRSKVSFAAHKPSGFPHGFVPKPTEW